MYPSDGLQQNAGDEPGPRSVGFVTLGALHGRPVAAGVDQGVGAEALIGRCVAPRP